MASGQEKGHQQLEAIHVLISLLGQDESIVVPVLEKLNVDLHLLRGECTKKLNSIPQVAGLGPAQLYVSQELAKILSQAEKEAADTKNPCLKSQHRGTTTRRAVPD